MIRNWEEIERAKREFQRKHQLTIEQKFALLDAMYEEVKQLDRHKQKNESDRIKHKLAMARILNAGV